MTLKQLQKLIATGAFSAGLLSGVAYADETTKTPQGDSNAPAMTAKPAKHSCAGQNGCKGQGGCKTSDGGCAGKNSCKGKGGCATDGSHHS